MTKPKKPQVPNPIEPDNEEEPDENEEFDRFEKKKLSSLQIGDLNLVSRKPISALSKDAIKLLKNKQVRGYLGLCNQRKFIQSASYFG